jgi:uncharacterized membrane protein YsdA (DUF1294 family)
MVRSPVASLVISGAFLVLLLVLALSGVLPFVVLWLYIIMSVLLFGTYAADKKAAQSGTWRTPETTLHLMALLGGWPGALVAQSVFRHKTRKRPFRAVFLATVIINCAALTWMVVAATTASV